MEIKKTVYPSIKKHEIFRDKSDKSETYMSKSTKLWWNKEKLNVLRHIPYYWVGIFNTIKMPICLSWFYI